jgi:hypothetical protein
VGDGGKGGRGGRRQVHLHLQHREKEEHVRHDGIGEGLPEDGAHRRNCDSGTLRRWRGKVGFWRVGGVSGDEVLWKSFLGPVCTHLGAVWFWRRCGGGGGRWRVRSGGNGGGGQLVWLGEKENLAEGMQLS